jgi:hypothetical protein
VVSDSRVVEGLCSTRQPLTAADAAERLATSRARSILVRNYIQNHFQLDPTAIGAVALENRPPAGLDRPYWNGIAIVILTSYRRR